MLTYKGLRASPRVDLSESVPLAAPFSVFIEPTNICNFRCVMCPESFPDYRELAGYFSVMPMELFDKILADLAEFGPIRTMKFYFEGEPLLNPALPAMIRKATDSGLIRRTELTTNASLLTEKRAADLIDSGLQYIRISVYSADNAGHKAITGTKIPPEKIAQNVARLRAMRDASGSSTPFIYGNYLQESPEGEAAFRAMYSGIVDELDVDFRHNWNGSDSRGGELVSISYAPGDGAASAFRHQKQTCPEPFYTLAIKANGDVTPCCTDWNGKMTLGNVQSQSLRAIWNGPELQRIQKAHVAKRRHEIESCRDCTMINHFPDNLDSLTIQEFEQRLAV